VRVVTDCEHALFVIAAVAVLLLIASHRQCHAVLRIRQCNDAVSCYQYLLVLLSLLLHHSLFDTVTVADVVVTVCYTMYC
jgi:hypothetical protein